MKPKICLSQVVFILAVFMSLLLAACGGNNASSSSGGSTDSSSSSSNSDQPLVATMPPAQFTAVANQSVTTTNVVTASQAVTAPESTQASAADLERGARAYTKNKCNECHGEKGEGVAGKGKALAGTALALDKFDNFLRTGGGQGNSHIFGPSALSPTGMQALYAYVKSLPAQ
jgi:mono/diheme cytochrome c family protein